MQLPGALCNFIIILFCYISAISGVTFQEYFDNRRYSQYQAHDTTYMLQNYRDVPVRDIPFRNTAIQDIPIRDLAIRDFPIRDTAIQDIPGRDLAIRNMPLYNPLSVKSVRSRSCWFCPPIQPVMAERSRDILIIPKRQSLTTLEETNDLLDLNSDTVETDSFWIETLHSGSNPKKNKDKWKKDCDDDDDKKHDKDDEDKKGDKDDQDKKHDKGDQDKKHDKDDQNKKHDKDDQAKKHDKDDQDKNHDKDDQDKNHDKDDQDKKHDKDDQDKKHDKDDQDKDRDKDDHDEKDDDEEKVTNQMGLNNAPQDTSWPDQANFNDAPPPDVSDTWSNPVANNLQANGFNTWPRPDFNNFPPDAPPNGPPNPFMPNNGPLGPPPGLGGPNQMPWQPRPFEFNPGFAN